jgi:dihydrofolate reductase
MYLYPQNLMSEYHIRYGGYGGIGYYLVADSYIALFSRFSTCGAWAGHYILDFIEENKSDVRPDTIHADTQGQSTSIFGLAYLLGIQLMPRIRNWKELNLCHPPGERSYIHIDSLFSTQVEWDLIETMLPDMLRAVALNTRPKYVASTTLTDLRWADTTVLSSEVAAAVGELRAKPGRELQVHGSGTLIRWLLDNDLVDEINLLTFPVVVGQGTRLFPDTGPDRALELVESRATPRGVTIQVYRPTGRPQYGTATVDMKYVS